MPLLFTRFVQELRVPRPAFRMLLAVSLCSTAPAIAQQPEATGLAQGKDLIAHLSQGATDTAADNALFHRMGDDEAQKLLLAVVANGVLPTATTEDWAAMHRAYAGLIELNAGDQQLLKASIFANLQDSAYRNNEGDYEAALAAARQALDLQQRSGELKTISIPWENLGDDLIHLGRIEEGANALYQARKLLDDRTSPLAADIWSKIISVESSRGNSAVAHSESEAFLNAAIPGTPPAFRASALLAAANLDIDDRRYDEAIARIHAALKSIKGAPDVMPLAYQAINVILTLGMEAMEVMPYEQALSLCGRLDKEFPGLPISITGFTHQVANHRRRLAGQFDLVLRDDAAELDRARGANDIPGQIASLLSTAVDYSYLRETAQQVTALEQAVDLLHSPTGVDVAPDLRYRALDMLGAAQFTRGDLRSSRAAYTEVLSGIEAITSAQMRAQLGTLYADAKLGLAQLLERDGDLRGARQILDRALNPPSGSLGHFTRSQVLLQLAALEQSAPPTASVPLQQSEAVRDYLDAIAALHLEKDVNSEVYARLKLVYYLATSAQTHAAPARPSSPPSNDSAAAMAREQLALARAASTSVGLSDSVWRVQFLQGILDENAGDRAAAIRSYAAAVDALDRIRTGLSEEEERRSFIDSASVQELYRRQIDLLTSIGDRQHAWEYLERNKARSFLESLNGRHFAAPSTGTSRASSPVAELDQLEEKILAERLSLSPENASALRTSGRSTDALHAKLIALENSFTLARQQKLLTEARATQPLALAPLSLAATERRLPVHTALIEYAILDKELAAFVVTHTSATELHWAADTRKLPSQLRRLNARLSAPPASDDDLDALLSSASDILLAPVLRVLAPDIVRLIVVPTQSLALIPFQALPLPQRATTGHRAPRPQVIDRYAVTYLPSASTLQFLHFGPPSASPDLFLGAIGNISIDNLPALPGTLAETEAIQKLYPGAVRVAGAAFTRQAAVDALQQHQEVHFATHGLFEEQAPLFSALITAPAAGQPSRLSLFEVMDLNLKARLVILSACETDRGQMTGGDETEGLTRTFLQAGAENVVSSLWKVSDESTTMLMESLHAHLRAGEQTPDALRHAEIALRQKFPQPFYWAAFVDTGLR